MAFHRFYTSFQKVSSDFNGLESVNEIIEKLFQINTEEIKFVYDYKNNERSLNLREIGNSKLNENPVDLNSIYKIYTEALYCAKSNIEKAYSYGNRSMVLYKMGLYKSCIVDINYAIELDYPKSKFYKLLVRKAESFLMLKDFENASSIFSDAIRNLEHSDTMVSSWKNRIENGLQLCMQKSIIKDLVSPLDLSLNYPKSCTPIHPSNCNISSFSDKLRLKFNLNDGRGIFADFDIKIGDVLAVEQPYAYRLTSERFLTHCYFCLRYQVNLIPCDRCSAIGFCNNDCLEKAKSHMRHDLECGMITNILSTKSKELGLLAYGTISKTPINTIRNVLKQIKSQKTNETNEIIDSQDYLSAISIVTNENMRDFIDLYDRCVSSMFLAHCFLKMLNHHEKKYDEDENVIVTLSRAFCEHLQNLPCNAHSLSETCIPTNGSLELSSVNYTGNALYPALSLINHSCSPNVVRITMDRGQCILKAISEIKTGEQIFDNYSLHFATTSLISRKENLKKQYYFDCQCLPCKENWPTFENQLQFPEDPIIICVKCKHEISMSTLFCSICEISMKEKYAEFLLLKSRLSENMELLLKKHFVEVEKYLLKFSALLFEIIKQPNILFNQTSEMLKLIWSMTGVTVSYF